MPGLGLPELGVVLVIVTLLFGSTKLPRFGKGLGGAISNFRSSVAGKGDIDQDGNKELK